MAALVNGCTALTDLSLSAVYPATVEESGESALRVLSGCHQLQSLRLSGFSPSAADDALQDGCCPLLSSLTLHRNELLREDKYARSLSVSTFSFQCARRRNLTSLSVRCSLYFGDDQLEAAVTECVGLRKLDVSNTRVSDRGIIAAVRACSDLRSLTASRCRYVTDASVRAVAFEGGRQLHELRFDETGVTHHALSFLARGPKCRLGLVTLLLYGSYVSGEPSTYPRLESLTSLDLLLDRYAHLQEVGLRIFDAFVETEQVEGMERMWGQAVLLRNARSLKPARELCSALKSATTKNKGYYRDLEEPRLPDWQCCGPFLRTLSRVGPSLRRLHLFADPRALFGDFEEEFLAFLGACPCLLSLRLTGITQVSDAILYKLGDVCPLLEQLAIAGSHIPFSQGVEHLHVTSCRLRYFEYWPDYYRDVLLGEADKRITYKRTQWW
ncbi:hypothetical protein CBR_g25804 [Chara braunii]|uniref:F-box domain-containing protein n=1 Tax=Chara braunii TaxID=69332 RepID=A0A388L6K6_CHABU|nr:hypothetical protein CBR_g25804 [Chara braunii]|eukprot:GBG77872.1 hypothetical protein CBR_g25804 [Chara braunii]